MPSRQQLTIRQSKFIDLYIETGNAYQSYMQAGYTNNTNSRMVTDVNACRLLKTDKIASAISQRINEHMKSSMVQFETKRLLLWEIAQESKLTDPKAAIAAITELNRMDGHHADAKANTLPEHFVFDAELLPPDGYLLNEPESTQPA